MSEDGNVVSFRPAADPKPQTEAASTGQDNEALANMLAFCERLDEGMKHVASVLVQLESRLRRLELEQRKTDREKAKPAIFDARGGRAN